MTWLHEYILHSLLCFPRYTRTPTTPPSLQNRFPRHSSASAEAWFVLFSFRSTSVVEQFPLRMFCAKTAPNYTSSINQPSYRINKMSLNWFNCLAKLLKLINYLSHCKCFTVTWVLWRKTRKWERRQCEDATLDALTIFYFLSPALER